MMKSKITKIQKILTKGIAIFIIAIFMLSSLSILKLFAVEIDDDVSTGSGIDEESTDIDYIDSEDSENMTNTIIKEIDQLKSQLAELNAKLNSNFTYESFSKKIASNKIIEVSTELELRALSIYVAEGNNCSGKTFRLKNNIALTDTLEWSPIGDNNNKFKGTIDGSGYTISGILISIKQSYAGLVGYLDNGGAIKDLTIANSNISIPPEVDNKILNDLVDTETVNYSYLGAFAGYANGATIINCQNKTNVSGGNIVGGIVGRMKNGSITYCSNSGYIQAYRTAGGIVGSYDVMLQNKNEQYKVYKCQNKGSIYAIVANAGGISGTLRNNGVISYCLNDGEVSNAKNIFKVYIKAEESANITPQNAGGIVGVALSDVIEGSVNTTEINVAVPKILYCLNDSNGKINGYMDIGGIAGQLGREGIASKIGNTVIKASVENCINNVAFNIDDYKNKKNVGEIVGRAGCKGAMGAFFKQCSYLNYVDAQGDSFYTHDIRRHETDKNKICAFGLNGCIWILRDNEYIGVDPIADRYQENGEFKKTVNTDIAKIKDTTAPELDNTIKATIVNYGSSQDFVIKGDVIKISIPFDEPINVNRIYPKLSLINGNIEADYIGIYENSLVFQYTVTGNENTLATSPYAIDNLKLTGTFYDIFGNKTSYSSAVVETESNIKMVNSNLESIKNASVTYTKDKIVYTISGFSNITEDGKLYYFNKNSTMKVTATFAGNLTHSGNVSESIESDIPKLQVKTNSRLNLFRDIEGNYNESDYTLTYNVGLSESASVSVEGLYLTTQNEIYIKGESAGILNEEKTLVNVKNIIIDTVAPTLTLSTTVNNETESGRYTVGEDILIKATTSEAIDLENSVLPEINVNFSTSGLGKYNYQGENAKTGNAKYMETIKNEDGTMTLKYRYTIQEGDEGFLKLDYANDNGIIIDIAGNETSLKGYPKNNTNDPMTQENLNGIEITGKENTVSFEIYKGNNKITNFKNNIYFSDGDTIKIKAIFSRSLYSSYGSSNTKVDKNTAPKLKINNIEFSIESISTDAKTITYYYKVNGNSNEQLNKITLTAKSSVYAKKEDNTYETISGNFITLPIANCNLYIHNNGTIFNESTVYADTTAPTVEITANKENPTNADLIKYTFKFSEIVEGFTAEDITVNNGFKATEPVGEGEEAKVKFVEVTKGLEYTLEVKPTIPAGNEGILQVVVEKGACQDTVGHENVRQENNITIDKVKPTFTSYEVKKETGKIIIEATFSEEISDASKLIPNLTIGGKKYRGTWGEVEIDDNNKVKFVYNISGADGGKVEASLVGIVKDKAGNDSETLDIAIENDITIEQTVIKNGKDTYSFKKGNTPISDFTKPTYFVKGNTITVTKDTETEVDVDGEKQVKIVTTNYTYTITEDIDLTHMKYMNLVEQAEGENTGKVTFSATAGSIDITEANIYFDTIAPKLTTKVYAENGKETQKYPEGTKVILETSIDEIINTNDANYKIPEIQVNFSQSGAGKYNFTNGKEGYAKYEKEIADQEGKLTYYYSYVIENGDEGILSIEYKNGKIVDLAGNRTNATNFNLAIPSTGNNNLSNNTTYHSNTNTEVMYEIYKNNNKVNNFNINTYFKTGDKIKVKSTINKILYTSWQSQTKVDTDKAPKLDIKIGNNILSSLNPSVIFNGYTTILTYEYTVKNADQSGKVTGLELSKTNTYYAIDEEHKIGDVSANNVSDVTISNSTSKISTNITDCNLVIDTVSSNEAIIINPSIYADTTVPTVSIIAKKVEDTTKTDISNNVTNANKLEYTFTWNEEVTGFEPKDITLNNGTKSTLSTVTDNKDGTYSYTMDVTPSIQNGNEGDIQVIVEKGACEDLVGHENVRTENVITVDKKAPTVEIVADKDYVKIGETINYTFNWSEAVTEFTADDITVNNATKGAFNKVSEAQYTLQVAPTNGNDVEVIVDNNKCTDIAKNNNIGNKHIIAVAPTVKIAPMDSKYDFNNDGYVDAKDVKLLQEYIDDLITNSQVKANIEQNGDVDCDGEISVNDATELQRILEYGINITNEDTIKYTFTWSEAVTGFTVDDITVNNGTKEELSGPKDNGDGTYSYTMDITNSVASGNTGNLQVIVEKGACEDLVGYENVRTESNITVDKKAPTVEIVADKDYVKIGETINYTFNWSEAVTGFTASDITVNNATKGEFNKVSEAQYTLQVAPTNGNDVEVIVDNNKCTDIAKNNNIGNKHIIAVVPTVKIATNKNNPTNASEITYTFTWSEEVKGFTPEEDIVVNNKATKGSLSDVIENEDGTYSYTMTVNYNTVIPAGNEGEVTVYVPEKAVQDVNGNENAYTSNTIKIDRIAPILINLEAYATSTIKVAEDVDSVKEYYKVGDKVTIIATFSENIENTTAIPTLALQFSESGNAKGTVSNGTIEGNKITYTYTITAKDMGTLSVKGFSGTVIDVAGNETIVTKRSLDGDTIIADTLAPKLVALTAIVPDFEYDELLEDPGDSKRYGVESKTREKNTITVIAEYSENIYKLQSNTVNNITSDTAPVLKLKFGSGTTRTATFDKIENNKIYYEYNIGSGDNGILAITSLTGTVSDIAGNIYTTSTTLPELAKYEDSISDENKVDNITADTTNPIFTITATAIDKDDNGNKITGNGMYYRKGSIITVTAKTNEYVYKNNNKELTRFAENGSDAPELNISFSTSGNGVGTCTNVEYTNNQTIFTYTYEVKENDNGTLNLNIAASQVYDIALNENNVKIQAISGIIADTVNPVTNWQSWVESEQYGIVDNMNGTWTVTFNEAIYVYNPNKHIVGSRLSNSNKSLAPVLLVSNDNTTSLETTIENITTTNNKTVITYTYNPYTKNLGAYGMKFASVSDCAGNLFNYKDQIAPTLTSIEVTDPITGRYKAGEEITIVATFSEKITGTAPKLQLQFSESGDTRGNVSAGVIEENTITYTYTITDGDNGVLSIRAFTGTGLKDLSDNLWVAPNSVTLSGSTITADTIAPTVTITSDVEITNKDIVKYTLTWSETVICFEEDDIELINGLKGDFKAVSNTDGKVYTLEVETIGEGRQIVKVGANVCTDRAGNQNEERVTYNNVVIDYTKPTVRAKVNGGNFVIDTDSKKSTLKETLVVNEEVSKFEYIWSKETSIPETGFTTINPSDIQINSDIKLETQVSETGRYYLYMKVTDLAGNTFVGRTNQFVVNFSRIQLTPNITTATNEDIIVTVNYGEVLTENRKAGIQGKTQSADSSKVIIGENGTVYAEATDIAGNKVYATKEITNIDKTAPKATIKYTTNEDGSVTATISFDEEATVTNNDGKKTYIFTENGEFTFEFEDSVGNQDTATAKVTSINKKEPEPTEPEEPPVEEDKTAPEITFNYTTTTTTVGTTVGATITTNEDAIISYSWDNKNWTASSGFVRSVNVKKTPTTAGTYTLYAKAADKSSNTSSVSTLQFTVVKSDDDIVKPEIIFEDLTTIQKDGVKYVKVSPNYTTNNLTSKMNKDALLGKTPSYTNLTSSKGLKTGSEIQINGDTKYIVIVKGDVNCDGKVDFLNDIVMINNYRIGINKNLKYIQILAGDINNSSGSIEFIPDIVAMNNYRLGRINVL